ncbi:MAG: urease accessory protein UreF [Cellvibrionaceae bacterium]|nr:urease accessory protein UreF [Cellvibrionaceae bacterium]
MNISHPALLKLLQLVSPALPVGAYAYSQGQEYAVEAAWVTSIDALEKWLSGIMHCGLGRLELPALQRCYQAWQHGDHPQLRYWNDLIFANRETHELLLEDQQLGLALARLLKALQIPGAELTFPSGPSFISMFALAGQQWQIPLTALSYGFTWSWLENQIAVATKTIPVGQTRAQCLLLKLAECIPDVVAGAQLVPDDELGASLPGLALASAQHEQQYSRLFRS